MDKQIKKHTYEQIQSCTHINICNKVVLAQSLTPCMKYETGKKHLDYQTLRLLDTKTFINQEEQKTNQQINRLTDTE
jgi:hypothetical protein